MDATNVLVIVSDEHSRATVGCYGNSLVRTPHIDRLALRGTRFTNAYASSPVCVSTRASIATGRYVHQIGAWDGAHPYDGRIPGWGHRLRETGHHAASIGKLHYRSSESDNGFSEEIMPLHVIGGTGDLLCLSRRDPLRYSACGDYAREIGPGESTYSAYDRKITAGAVEWLATAATQHRDTPWVLFVSFVSPHFPLIAPPEFYALYHDAKLPPPRLYDAASRPTHPVLLAMADLLDYDAYFDPERVRIALASYYGLCSFLDHNVGQVIAALEASGFADTTRIIYTSDHGDCLGNRGIWAKSVMYEESVAIPLVMAGPGIPVGRTVSTPVSHVDLGPTIIEAVGEAPGPDLAGNPGASLLGIATAPPEKRTILSEYHDAGSITGMFMIRSGRWKYVHYVGYEPQLFDLEGDPGEEHDLGTSDAFADVRRACEAELRRILDPDAVNEQAFAEQEALMAAHGGREAIRMKGDFGYSPVPGGPIRYVDVG